MYDKTSSSEFKKYGLVYSEPKNVDFIDLIEKKITTDNKIISHLYKSSNNLFIEIEEGMAYILIKNDIDDELKIFGIHRNLEIYPNMSFNIIPITNKVTYSIILNKNDGIGLEFLNKPYVYEKIVQNIKVSEILAYYYSIKSPKYKFCGEKHNIYELTLVDNGELQTTIDDEKFTLSAYDLIIYSKNSFHTQQVNNNLSCSYLTVLFDMVCEDDSKICNRIFHCKNEVYNIIKIFIKNLSKNIPYSKELILVNFNELIIRLFQYEYLNIEKNKIVKENYSYFQNEILNNIINYIDDNIYNVINVEDICNTFAISRSSLQLLFKNNLDITPKKYIINLKLSKSKLLIRENKYTISEIAFMLGFSSIHYFSKAFTNYYNISPSDYANTFFN